MDNSNLHPQPSVNFALFNCLVLQLLQPDSQSAPGPTTDSSRIPVSPGKTEPLDVFPP